MEKMEKEKDRQDLEIESIIQVIAEGISGGTISHRLVFAFNLYLCLAACTRIRNQTKGGRGKRKEETEGGADGAGEAAEGGRDGKRKFSR